MRLNLSKVILILKLMYLPRSQAQKYAATVKCCSQPPKERKQDANPGCNGLVRQSGAMQTTDSERSTKAIT